MSEFLRDLRRHRAEAAAERERLDQRINALDVLIEQETSRLGEPTAPAPVVTTLVAPRPLTARRTLPGAVVRALGEAGEPLGFADLHARVAADLGTVNEKSLRGTLPRMQRDGQIVKPARGVYALPQDTDPDNVVTRATALPSSDLLYEAAGESPADRPDARHADA